MARTITATPTPQLTTSTTNSGRIDYNMSDKNRMFFDIRRTHLIQEKNNYFGNGTTATELFRNNWGSTIDDVYMVNATNVIDVRLNFTRMAEIHANPTDGFNPTTLGFPSYIAGNSTYLQMPYIQFAGSCGSQTSFQCIGGTETACFPPSRCNFTQPGTRSRAITRLKSGIDVRQYRLNTFTPGNSASDLLIQCQQLGEGFEQRVFHRRMGTGFRRVHAGTANQRRVGLHRIRLLVFLLRRRIRAGRLAGVEQPHRQHGLALRPRRAVQRKIRTHRGRLRVRHPESAAGRGAGSLCQESGSGASRRAPSRCLAD